MYNVIKAYPNITDKEIAKVLKWPINRVTPRRGELYPRYIKCTGVRMIEGFKSKTWKVI